MIYANVIFFDLKAIVVDSIIKRYNKVPVYVGRAPQFYINYSMALEMVYRSWDTRLWNKGIHHLYRLSASRRNDRCNIVGYYNDTPYHKDYVVRIQNEGEDTHTLAIDLHPRTDATLRDAILNGVEVFKLSDLSGNLAGLNMVPPPMDQQPALAANKSNTKKTMFIAIESGVGFLVVAALACFMVLCKLKKTECYGSYHSLAKWWCWLRPDPYKREFSRRTMPLLQTR
nr:receptor-like protein kinase feronia [Quercus suber]